MTHQLRSIIRRPRFVLAAAAGATILVLSGPAAAGCTPLDDLPPVGVPGVPGLPPMWAHEGSELPADQAEAPAASVSSFVAQP